MIPVCQLSFVQRDSVTRCKVIMLTRSYPPFTDLVFSLSLRTYLLSDHRVAEVFKEHGGASFDIPTAQQMLDKVNDILHLPSGSFSPLAVAVVGLIPNRTSPMLESSRFCRDQYLNFSPWASSHTRPSARRSSTTVCARGFSCLKFNFNVETVTNPRS